MDIAKCKYFLVRPFVGSEDCNFHEKVYLPLYTIIIATFLEHIAYYRLYALQGI